MGLKLKNDGSALERLVLMSRGGVDLDRIAQSSKRIGAKLVVPIRGPADFFGNYTFDGRAIFFDCKSSGQKASLNLSRSHFPDNQREFLVRKGRANAVSGILAENTLTRRLYWANWQQLERGETSIRWTDLADIGANSQTVNWRLVLHLAGESAGNVPHKLMGIPCIA